MPSPHTPLASKRQGAGGAPMTHPLGGMAGTWLAGGRCTTGIFAAGRSVRPVTPRGHEALAQSVAYATI